MVGRPANQSPQPGALLPRNLFHRCAPRSRTGVRKERTGAGERERETRRMKRESLLRIGETLVAGVARRIASHVT